MDIYWTSQISLAPTGSPELVKQHGVMVKGGMSPANLNIDLWLPAGFERPNIDPPGVNTLHVSPSDLELDDWAALFELDLYAEPRGMLVADVVGHVREQGYSRTDGQRVAPQSQFGFSELLAALDSDVDLVNNFRPDTIRSVRQRMTSLAGQRMFSTPGTSIRDILSPSRVSVLMLGRLPDALKKVLTAVLLRRLMRERKDASLAQKRLDLDPRVAPDERARLEHYVATSVPRSWVLLDEAHVLAAAEEPSVSRDALIRYAKEGRNSGLSLAIATQQPSALDARLMSQVETMIVHQLTSPRDAAVATQSMRSPAPSSVSIDGVSADPASLLRRLGQGLALVSSGNAPRLPRPIVCSIRPRVTAHGGYEA